MDTFLGFFNRIRSLHYILIYMHTFVPVHEISNDFDILRCVDSDEPLQSPFKLRNSKWCSVA